MELYMEQAVPQAGTCQQILRLPGDREVTLTFAGTGSAALKTAKEILIHYSVKKLINKGII